MTLVDVGAKQRWRIQGGGAVMYRKKSAIEQASTRTLSPADTRRSEGGRQ